MLSALTSLAGVVTLPRQPHVTLRHIEFLPLSGQRVLAILVVNDAEVQNRILDMPRDYSEDELRRAANYLNQQFTGRDISDVRSRLLDDLDGTRESMNRLMLDTIAVADKGQHSGRDAPGYVLSGETQLMNFHELSDVEKIKQLFEAFGEQREILTLLDRSLEADGVQIFIGEESGYRMLDNCTIVAAPYSVDEHIVGVLGVIGPTRMAYERVIPIVDITARLVGAALNSTALSPHIAGAGEGPPAFSAPARLPISGVMPCRIPNTRSPLQQTADAGGGGRPAAADPVAELREALSRADATAADNWNRYLRSVAEMENVRKRAARDIEAARRAGVEKLASELLAIVDTLELGLESAGTASVESLLAGKEATLRLLQAAFEKFNIEVVDPTGYRFDPQLHEAMSMQPSNTAEPNSVLAVLQKGYRIGDRLLRPARVIVAGEPVVSDAPGADEPAGWRIRLKTADLLPLMAAGRRHFIYDSNFPTERLDEQGNRH